MEIKRCRICLIEKKVNHFRNSYLTKKFGARKRSECIICENKVNNKRAKLWYSKYRKAILENAKTPNAKKRRKENRLKHIVRYKKKAKEQRIKHREKINERTRKWNEKNKFYVNQIYRKRLDVICRLRIHSANRRKMIQNVNDGTLTSEGIKNLLKTQNYKCNMCYNTLEGGNMHLDHIKPISKGGSHSLANVQWLCRNCNLKKYNSWLGQLN